MTLGVGSIVLGKWTIVAHLGRGGMGDAWRVEAVDGPISAALKTLRSDAVDEDGLRRFVREATLMSKVRHSNVVSLHEIGRLDDGTPCFIMDLVVGDSLEARLERLIALPWQTARTIASDVLRGLQAAHDVGVIHRDIKPANILLRAGSPERACVADFGIARVDDGSMTRMTATGIVTGTVDYMSPEQLQDGSVDGRSDVYSAGLTVWRMVAGALPFPELSGVARALRRCVADPGRCAAPAGMPDLPRAVEESIHAMVERRQDNRPTALEAMQLLQASDAAPAITLRYAPVTEAPSSGHPTSDASEQQDVASDRTLVVVRLPPSRLAMPSERKWLASVAAPSRAFTLGAFWFAVVDSERAEDVTAAVQRRFGAISRHVLEKVDPSFAISAAASLGGSALPPPLARALEKLAADRG